MDTKTFKRWASKLSYKPDTGCWIWTGGGAAYGNFHLRQEGPKQVWIAAHVIAYQHFIDPDYKSTRYMVLDHIVCNNKKCCNPYHVESVTQSVNMQRRHPKKARNRYTSRYVAYAR
jgi:hypothetical protein